MRHLTISPASTSSTDGQITAHWEPPNPAHQKEGSQSWKFERIPARLLRLNIRGPPQTTGRPVSFPPALSPQRRHKVPFSPLWNNPAQRPRNRVQGPFQAENGPSYGRLAMRRQPTSNPTRADSTRTASSSRHHRPPLTIGAAGFRTQGPHHPRCRASRHSAAPDRNHPAGTLTLLAPPLRQNHGKGNPRNRHLRGDFATRNRTMMRHHIHSIAHAGWSC